MVTKKTEIGVLPSDWSVVTLLDCLCGKPSYGINAPAIAYSPQKPRYIRITDITEAGTYSKSSPASVEDVNIDRYYLKKNDIVLARTGASVGKSYLYQKDDGNLVYAGFLIKVSINDIVADARYVFACLHTQRYWQWVNTISVRSGQPGINGEEYSAYLLPLPSRVEQTVIADSISDVDSLISSLQKLIEKKKAIRQGAMQELLTGKKRLPGFSGEWNQFRLGEMTEIYSGGTPSTTISEYWGGSIPWMSSGELNNKKIYDVEGRITQKGMQNSSAHLIPKYCVLIGLAGQGKTRGTAAYNYISLCTNQSIAAIYPNDKKFDSRFLYYIIDSMYESLRELSSGDGGRGGLTKGLISNLEIYMPEVPEQQAVAQVLSDMDSEIEQLEKKLSKYQLIKQGMMQELLTGRIRLKEGENNA